jgi:FkbM family methyltransferase
VIAIEAHPIIFDHLRRFCELNRLNNVVPIHTAVMDVPGIVQIHDGEFWQFNTVRTAGSGTQVRATTLDNLRNEQQLDNIDFLKMNIEGAEIRALQGMKDTIANVQNICVCCHDFRADRGHGEEYRTRDFVSEFLTENGFSVSRRTLDSRDFVRDHVFGIRSGA